MEGGDNKVPLLKIGKEGKTDAKMGKPKICTRDTPMPRAITIKKRSTWFGPSAGQLNMVVAIVLSI